jgi:hypothetical protein
MQLTRQSAASKQVHSGHAKRCGVRAREAPLWAWNWRVIDRSGCQATKAVAEQRHRTPMTRSGFECLLCFREPVGHRGPRRSANTDKVKELSAQWDAWAGRCQVLPLGGGEACRNG